MARAYAGALTISSSVVGADYPAVDHNDYLRDADQQVSVGCVFMRACCRVFESP